MAYEKTITLASGEKLKVPSHSYLPTRDGSGARQHSDEVEAYVAQLNTDRELLQAAVELINEVYQGGGDARLADVLIRRIGKLLTTV